MGKIYAVSPSSFGGEDVAQGQVRGRPEDVEEGRVINAGTSAEASPMMMEMT